jgi:hypothetical protein
MQNIGIDIDKYLMKFLLKTVSRKIRNKILYYFKENQVSINHILND